MGPGIDHLVVGAADLDTGRRQVADFLGVPLSPGGRHDHMGTHNCLPKLGPACYLEVIAIDPCAEPPDRPRWFALDRPETAARLAAGPALLTWVVHGVNTERLAPEIRPRIGSWKAMRRGDLRWRLTLGADGRLPAAGALPALIKWSSTNAGHPARGLPDRDCHLERLHLDHPEAETIVSAFTALGVSGLKAVCPSEKECHNDFAPVIAADIRTPRGRRQLSSLPPR